MNQIIAQFELQTKLFKNATTAFNEADAGKSTGEANHAKWLIGHTVSGRYMIANILGLNQSEPFPDLFSNLKGIQKDIQYPSMADLTKDWDAISEKVIGRLKEMTDADFNAPEPFPHPMSDGTLKGVFGFFAHHEAYTLGQIGYIRRIFGMEAMKYN